MSNWKHERGRVASLTRSRTPDDPELVEARRNLKSERLALTISAAINNEPALTGSQLGELASKLLPGGGS